MLKLQMIGNLGKDAEIKTVNGKQLISFSVAHSEKVKGEDKTTWVNCSYFSDSKIFEYLKKGTKVYIEGKPSIRTYDKDGTKNFVFDLLVNFVELLGTKNDNSNDLPF